MKFFIGLIAICIGYYFFIGPNQTPAPQPKIETKSTKPLPNQSTEGIQKSKPNPDEIQTAAREVQEYSWTVMAPWVVVTVVFVAGIGSKILRVTTSSVKHSKTAAHNELINQIKAEDGKIRGYEFGKDEGGYNETILYTDTRGVGKAKTIINTDDLPSDL